MSAVRFNKTKIIIPAVLTVLLGTAGATMLNKENIEADLSARASQALKEKGLDWAKVNFNALDAKISGTAPTPEQKQQAAQIVKSVYGVRTIATNIDLLPSVSPYPFVAKIDNSKITLSGAAPDEATKKSLIARSLASSNDLRLFAGYPDKSKWLGAVDFAFRQLRQFEVGEISLSDLTMSISGRAKSHQAYESLQAAISADLPDGVVLGDVEIIPPIASPYEWSAKFDGSVIEITGNSPSQKTSEEFLSKAPEGVKIEPDILLSSGEPENFSQITGNIMQAFNHVEYGEASIKDKNAKFFGAPKSEEAVEKINSLLASHNIDIKLEPPRIANYRFYADKQNGKISLSGYVPHENEKARLGEIENFDVSELKLGWGAPDNFDKSLNFGLDALNLMSEGRFALEGEELALAGSAKNSEDFEKLTDLIAKGVSGATIKTAQISPPNIDLFTWSAKKDTSGEIKLSGYVPDLQTKQQLANLANASSENMLVALGAPENFAENAKKGLEILAKLDNGEVKLGAGGWTLSGQAKSYELAGEIRDTLKQGDWHLEIASPPKPLPVASPYLWSLERDKDGAHIFSGYVPQESLKNYLALLAENVKANNVAIAKGEPDNFNDIALASLEALALLEEGKIEFDGSNWSFSGKASSIEEKENALAIIGEITDISDWEINIDAPKPIPTASPYLWSLERDKDGAHIFSGYVPQESLKNYLALLAENVKANNITIAKGEPDNFNESTLAALKALSFLEKGRAAYNGSEWSLIGKAASLAEKDKAFEALNEQIDVSKWKIAIEAPKPVADKNYRFVATKSSDGNIALAGNVPNNELMNYLSIKAGNAKTDNIYLLAPAPDNFKRSVFAALNALNLLDEGQFSLRSRRYYLTGIASNEEVKEKALSLIEPAKEKDNWTINIKVAPPEPEPAPPTQAPQEETIKQGETQEKPAIPFIPQIVSDDYRFVATKFGDKTMAIVGDVPNEQTKNYVAIIAGNVPSDNVNILSPAPKDFKRSLFNGIHALNMLEQGQLSFRAKRWYLTGLAGDKEISEKVISQLKEAGNIDEWTINIQILKPKVRLCRKDVEIFTKENAILFDVGKSFLRPESIPVIKRLAALMQNCPETDIHVQGHTDSDGSYARNMTLSVDRAESVVNALIEAGVDSERLFAVGYGEYMPIATNKTEEGKQKNRRTVFSILSKSD